MSHDPLSSSNPSFPRRAFLRHLASLSATTATAAAGLTLTADSAKAQSGGGLKPIGFFLGVPIYLAKLQVIATTEKFPDFSSLPFFRYKAIAPVKTLGSIPMIDIPEGSILIVEFENQIPIPILPNLVGGPMGPVIAPKTKDYLIFLAPRAGTHLIGNAGWLTAGGPAGMGAVLVTRPKSGKKELWAGGPRYDKEFILAYHDTDDRWNRAIASLKLPNFKLYEPNYFTVNGLTYPKTATDPSTKVLAKLNERVLIRFANFGRLRQSIHFHGYHADIAARNNIPEKNLGPKDTIPVPSLQSCDVIYKANQRGKYPLHPHFVPAVTANGTYPFGTLALIETI